jgi:cytochrome P450/NADPH-cytochrome P450 reductase
LELVINTEIFIIISSAGLSKAHDEFGPLISIRIMGLQLLASNSPVIAELLVKESKYFTKKITGGLKVVKDFAGNGLFTSDTDHDNWKLAHKLLMPAFSARAIKVHKKLYYSQNKALITVEI